MAKGQGTNLNEEELQVLDHCPNGLCEDLVWITQKRIASSLEKIADALERLLKYTEMKL